MTALTADPIPDLTSQRYFSNRHSAIPAGFTSTKHAIRATAKRIAQSKNQHACDVAGVRCIDREWPHHKTKNANGRCTYTQESTFTARHHFEHFLDCALDNDELRVSTPARRRTNKADQRKGTEDDISLARSDVPLPSDASRQRRPSFERQDAFYDESTASRKIRIRKAVPVDEDAQIAQLYETGILYDESRGSQPLTLDNIAHEEPTYPIRIIKKARKPSKRSHTSLDRHQLTLDLSFTNIGDDEQIISLASSPFDESIQHASGSPPLRVIYELGSPSSIDIDASQPPDLMYEYDCVSDMDLDEIPSQEVASDEHTDPPSDTWVMLGDGL